MRILFVVPYAPNLLRTRSYHLLRGLAQRGHAITLATLWQTEDERTSLNAWSAQGLRVVAEPLGTANIARNLARALGTGLPLQARYCWQPALARKLEALVSQRPSVVDAVHVEHLRGAEYGRQFRRHGAPPILWDSVDCISMLFEQTARSSRRLFSRALARLELPRTRRYEGRAVHEFCRVLATSARDKAALDDLASAYAAGPTASSAASADGVEKVRVLGNGVDFDYFKPGQPLSGPERVVMTGKMSYHANVTAAQSLVRDIMPAVWRQRPDVRVVIAGSAPPRSVRDLSSDARVEVTGFVPDLASILRSATVAAAPIAYGAGIQNKVLEAMASGVPVVASPLAASALTARPGHELLVAAEPGDFAAALLRLLAEPVLRTTIGAAGRRYVVQHHHWSGIVGELEGIYNEFIGTTAQHAG